MDPNLAIQVDHVTVRFNRASQRADNLKKYCIKMLRKELMFQGFFALQDISLDIKAGNAWGIIGRNSSVKSTLLKVFCGTLSP